MNINIYAKFDEFPSPTFKEIKENPTILDG